MAVETYDLSSTRPTLSGPSCNFQISDRFLLISLSGTNQTRDESLRRKRARHMRASAVRMYGPLPPGSRLTVTEDGLMIEIDHPSYGL